MTASLHNATPSEQSFTLHSHAALDLDLTLANLSSKHSLDPTAPAATHIIRHPGEKDKDRVRILESPAFPISPALTASRTARSYSSASSSSSPERGRTRTRPGFLAPASTSQMEAALRDVGVDNEFDFGIPTAHDHLPITNGVHKTENPISATPVAADDSFDLNPPAPAKQLSNVELLAERLFSVDHLNSIVRDRTQLARFGAFLSRYKSGLSHQLQRYLEIQKAIYAIEYANSVVAHMSGGTGWTEKQVPIAAAMLDDKFARRARTVIEDLTHNALPAYLTHRFVQQVTDTLVKEITGQSAPIMRDLVRGLAEVYCMTDPNLHDNPIVYASEEFYNCTQYGRDYVIGRNCRMLQGPKTSDATVGRLVEALSEGQEVCETILNYRRDGSPFINLLMIAPLYDNRGAVRYFLGAQIDISGLVQDGRGLESFANLLESDRKEARRHAAEERESEEYDDQNVQRSRHRTAHRRIAKPPDEALAELAPLWREKELSIIKKSSRSNVQSHFKHGHDTSIDQNPPTEPKRSARVFVGMDDPNDTKLWPAPGLGRNGRLPGVFSNYLLIRPAPSLKITFTSPALRIPGLLQSKFLDRIGGAPNVRQGVRDALYAGVSVTAKVVWLRSPIHSDRDDTELGSTAGDGGRLSSGLSSSLGDSRPDTAADSRAGTDNEMAYTNGKQRWIHCTPLLGADDRVGVWMIVMVEGEQITGQINATTEDSASMSVPVSGVTNGMANGAPNGLDFAYDEGLINRSQGIEPSAALNSNAIVGEAVGPAEQENPRAAQTLSNRSSDRHLYHDYLRRDDREVNNPIPPPVPESAPNTRAAGKPSTSGSRTSESGYRSTIGSIKKAFHSSGRGGEYKSAPHAR